MPSRTLTLALALLASTDIPSVLARVGIEKNQSQVSQTHSLLRRRLESAELPLADKKLVKEVDLKVVQLPKWNGIASNAIEIPWNEKDEN
jgi:hypothetical protein